VAAGLADLGTPWLDDAEELVRVVAERLDGRAHLHVSRELDRLTDLATLVGERPVGEQPSRHQMLLGSIELRIAPRAGAPVGTRWHTPELFGQQADLRRVESCTRPGCRMRITPVLAELVAVAPQIAPRRAWHLERQQSRVQRPSFRAQRCSGL